MSDIVPVGMMVAIGTEVEILLQLIVCQFLFRTLFEVSRQQTQINIFLLGK